MAYRGNIAVIPVGQFGLLTDLPPGEIPRGAFIRANNISFETGVVTKAPGAMQYNTFQLPSGIVAGFDWWPNVVTQRTIVACANGSIYRDIGDRLFSSGSAIASGLGTLTPRSMFIAGGNETADQSKKLFFFSDGLAQVKVLTGDGTTFSDISNPAADWTSPNYPTCGCVFRERLWAFMGNRAYASDTGNHENFATNYLTDAIYPGEGGSIIGCFTYREKLFVFKQGGFVYILNDTDPNSINWYWVKFGENFGLASPHAAVQIDDDMYAVNEAGQPISYQTTQKFGNFESGDLMRLLMMQNYFRTSVSQSGLSVMHTLYYPAKKQAFFTYRTGAQIKNDQLLVVDFSSNERPKASLWPAYQADCLFLRKDSLHIQRPCYGSADGYLYFMDREDRNIGGAAYTGEFKTSHMDFRWFDERLAERNKLFDFLTLEFIPQGSWNVSVDVYIDGNFSETINFTQDVRTTGLGTFQLGSTPLGREESQMLRMPLHGSGRRISFHVKGAGLSQNFAIASLTVGFRASAEQATRV